MHRKMIAAGLPLSGTIEVTRRCPLTCAHCYNNLPMGDRGAAQRELSCDEHCRLLDEIADAGCLWLLYTGGEIFARRDFIDIYSYARRRGLLITLFTNGTLITPALADRLVEERPFAIEITLYGRTRETYERLTGIPGSYDRCLRGIRLLQERGLPLSLKTVAVTINKHEVFAMQRFAEEELGLAFKFDAMMNPRLDCSRAPLGVRLTPEECVSFDVADPKRMDEWTTFGNRALTSTGERRTNRRSLLVRRRAHVLCHQPLRRVEHLYLVPAGSVRPEIRQFQGRLGDVSARGAIAKSHPSDQVHHLPDEGDVRHVPGERRARERPSGGAGRLPLPDGSPARVHVRLPGHPSRRVRVLPGRKRV